MKNPTVILAEDGTCFRQLMAMWLRQEKYEVVGEAADGPEALKLCLKLKPSILITELRLPALDGVVLLGRLRGEKVATPVVIFTDCAEDRVLAAARAANPAALIHKKDGMEHFRDGLRQVLQGAMFYSPRVVQAHRTAKLSDGNPELSARETDVVRLVGNGKSNKIAAGLLDVTEKAIEHSRENAMRKLGVHNGSELTLAAIRLGLVSVE